MESCDSLPTGPGVWGRGLPPEGPVGSRGTYTVDTKRGGGETPESPCRIEAVWAQRPHVSALTRIVYLLCCKPVGQARDYPRRPLKQFNSMSRSAGAMPALQEGGDKSQLREPDGERPTPPGELDRG